MNELRMNKASFNDQIIFTESTIDSVHRFSQACRSHIDDDLYNIQWTQNR